MDKSIQKIKIFIICSGLGHVKRGFESFSQECFSALSQDQDLEIILFKGGGAPGEREVVLPNLPRHTWIANLVSQAIRRDAYFVEQCSFFLSLLSKVYHYKPNVIYFSDGSLGNLLWHWRRLTSQSYKLLFSNGGPLSPPFDRWDHVQQVAPIYLETALKAGVALEKQSLVPYGLHIPAQLQILTTPERVALRAQLGLPEDQTLILSVGAINRFHKRMDYVIRELAALPEPRPYLVLLGEQEPESQEIIQMGHELLGEDGFQVKTVPAQQVAHYYKVADVFVLASLQEGFGRVFLEAMSHGLPCAAHDYEVTRFILGDEGYLANLEMPGHLSGLIAYALVERDSLAKHQQRYQKIYERFSWEKLRPSYVEMIHRCAVLPNEMQSPTTSTMSSKF